MGYPSALRSRYLESGWLQRVCRGVFRRPAYVPGLEGKESPLRWQHIVISLQMVLERPIVVGGRSALELSGFSHYVSSTELREVHLYADEPPPKWLPKLPMETTFRVHRAQKLFRTEPISKGFEALTNMLSAEEPLLEWSIPGHLTWTHLGEYDWPLVLSTPERACLELLDEIPGHETFHQADMLLQSLTSLSPTRLARLLGECRSVKVKRLFLWFAERHGHAWLKRLDREDIDLGSGKRMLVRGGKLDPKYLITIPADLHAGR